MASAYACPLIEVVRLSVYLPRNARALMRAKQLGGDIKYLSQGEIDARNAGYRPYSVEDWSSGITGKLGMHAGDMVSCPTWGEICETTPFFFFRRKKKLVSLCRRRKALLRDHAEIGVIYVERAAYSPLCDAEGRHRGERIRRSALRCRRRVVGP